LILKDRYIYTKKDERYSNKIQQVKYNRQARSE
jgi:hypothetical protein